MSDKDRTREADLRRRLSEVLGIYGANPGRWPIDERDSLSAVADEMDVARERAELAKAQADEERNLDRLLDLVDPPAPPEGAMERVIALAGGKGGEVIAFSTHGAPSSGSRVSDGLVSEPIAGRLAGGGGSVFTFRPAVGFVAASLLLGLIAGTSNVADPLYILSMDGHAMESDDTEAGILGLAREDGAFEEDDL